MIEPDELHELLHAHAASIEPDPHLAELGTALTVVERHRRTRVFVGTTIVVVVVAAAVTAVRTIETRPTRFDTAPATQRVVVVPDPRAVTSTTLPSGNPVNAATPTSTVAPATTPATTPGGAGVVAAPAVTTPPKTTAPDRVLTFRAASVSDLSSADPPSVDYFGVAPPGATVTATSSYGTASTRAGSDSKWSLHLVLPNAPVGQRVKVVLSAPPLPSLTFSFTHTTD